MRVNAIQGLESLGVGACGVVVLEPELKTNSPGG